MASAKIADLKNNLSRYLAQVRRGGEVVVLDRDIPIARIIPFAPREDDAARRRADEYWTPERLASMERDGLITRGSRKAVAAWLRERRPVKLPPGSPSVVGLLLRMRRESTR